MLLAVSPSPVTIHGGEGTLRCALDGTNEAVVEGRVQGWMTYREAEMFVQLKNKEGARALCRVLPGFEFWPLLFLTD